MDSLAPVTLEPFLSVGGPYTQFLSPDEVPANQEDATFQKICELSVHAADLCEKGQFDDFLESLDQILSLRRTMFGESDGQYQDALKHFLVNTNELGIVYFRSRGKMARSAELFKLGEERSREIENKSERDVFKAVFSFNISNYCFRRHKYSLAAAYTENALQSWKHSDLAATPTGCGPDSDQPVFALLCAQFAAALAFSGSHTRAVELNSDALLALSEIPSRPNSARGEGSSTALAQPAQPCTTPLSVLTTHEAPLSKLVLIACYNNVAISLDCLGKKDESYDSSIRALSVAQRHLDKDSQIYKDVQATHKVFKKLSQMATTMSTAIPQPRGRSQSSPHRSSPEHARGPATAQSTRESRSKKAAGSPLGIGELPIGRVHSPERIYGTAQSILPDIKKKKSQTTPNTTRSGILPPLPGTAKSSATEHLPPPVKNHPLEAHLTRTSPRRSTSERKTASSSGARFSKNQPRRLPDPFTLGNPHPAPQNLSPQPPAAPAPVPSSSSETLAVPTNNVGRPASSNGSSHGLSALQIEKQVLTPTEQRKFSEQKIKNWEVGPVPSDDPLHEVERQFKEQEEQLEAERRSSSPPAPHSATEPKKEAALDSASDGAKKTDKSQTLETSTTAKKEKEGSGVSQLAKPLTPAPETTKPEERKAPDPALNAKERLPSQAGQTSKAGSRSTSPAPPKSKSPEPQRDSNVADPKPTEKEAAPKVEEKKPEATKPLAEQSSPLDSKAVAKPENKVESSPAEKPQEPKAESEKPATVPLKAEVTKTDAPFAPKDPAEAEKTPKSDDASQPTVTKPAEQSLPSKQPTDSSAKPTEPPKPSTETKPSEIAPPKPDEVASESEKKKDIPSAPAPAPAASEPSKEGEKPKPETGKDSTKLSAVKPAEPTDEERQKAAIKIQAVERGRQARVRAAEDQRKASELTSASTVTKAESETKPTETAQAK